VSSFDSFGCADQHQHSVGGKLYAHFMSTPATSELSANNRAVFVVHGRNSTASEAMFTFLRALDLQPIEWDQAVGMTGKGTPYIGEVLDVAFERGQAVLVLMTPDDIAYQQPTFADGEHDPEATPSGQARPNVLFEAGMAMGRNADRTILVELGELRPFSDVGGRHALRMNNSPERRQSLASRLETAGCAVDRSGSDWLRAGDFTAPERPGGGLPLGRRVPPSAPRPASVDGRWFAESGPKFDQLRVTNTGSAPILKAAVEVPKSLEREIQLHQDAPVMKLPPSKSFTVRAWTSNKTMGGGAPDQFELTVTGRLEDGTLFSQDIFVDTVA